MRAWILLTLFTLSASAPALANDLGRMDCFSGPDDPTYQLIRINADEFSLRVYFPNSLDSLPIHSGDVPASLLKWLIAKNDFAQKLGNSYHVKIPRGQCIRDKSPSGLFYIHCYTKEQISLNGTPLNGVSFYASSKKVISASREGGVVKEVVDEQTRVGVEVGMPTKIGTQWVDMAKTFVSEECRITPKFWE